MNRAILVVSYFTNEDTMACSHHVDDRLACLAEKGVRVGILSSWCVAGWDRYPHWRTPSLWPSGIRFEIRRRFHHLQQQHRLWKVVRNLVLIPFLPLYGLERMVSRLDPTWHWQGVAVWAGIRLCRHLGADTVYSTGGPPVAHVVGRAIAERCGLKWLAEVQDPLIHGYCARHWSEYQRLQEVEAMICNRADRMIFLTRGALRATRSRQGHCDNGVVIHSGVRPLPEAVSDGSRRDGVLRMAHFGSLCGVRRLDSLVRALEILLEKDPEAGQKLRIDLFGSVDRDVWDVVAQSGVCSLFHRRGVVDRDTALAAMRNCDLLLLVQAVHDISRETIPSKVYEYFLAGPPVLALIHENGELEEMCSRLGHYPVAAADAVAIAGAVERLLGLHRRTGIGRPRPSPYTVERAVEKLLAL